MADLAVFTMVQNETYFLEKWVAYYGAELGFDDMYVLQHGWPAGPSADLLEKLQAEYGFHVLPVSSVYSYDANWMQRTIQHFQHYLMQSYELTLYASADQFLVPAGGTLQAYIDDWMVVSENSCLVPQGYEVLHLAEELPLDLSQDSWLEQRSAWYPCRAYTRPLLSRIPLYWGPQQRTAYNIPRDHCDQDIYLIHLHRICRNLCLARHREIKSRLWDPMQRHQGIYRYNLIEDPEMLSKWMLADSDDTSRFATPVEIPEAIKGAF